MKLDAPVPEPATVSKRRKRRWVGAAGWQVFNAILTSAFAFYVWWDGVRREERREREAKELKLIGVANGGEKLRVIVPDRFMVSKARIYVPTHKTPLGHPFLLGHPEVTCDLSYLFKDFSDQLAMQIMANRPKHGTERVGKVYVKIPVVIDATYLAGNQIIDSRDYYTLHCGASWNSDDQPVKVHFEVEGLRWQENAKALSGIDGKLKEMWNEELERLEDERVKFMKKDKSRHGG